MTKDWPRDTKWFFSKASGFVLVISTLVYLLLLILNSQTDDFVVIYFNTNILLIASVISGLTFVLSRE